MRFFAWLGLFVFCVGCQKHELTPSAATSKAKPSVVIAPPPAAPSSQASSTTPRAAPPFRASTAMVVMDAEDTVKLSTLKDDDKRALATLSRRRALVAIANSRKVQAKPAAGARPKAVKRVLFVARGAGFGVTQETALRVPVSVVLAFPGWAPCVGTANFRLSLEVEQGDNLEQLDALLVEGCAIQANRYAVLALEGASGVKIKRVIDEETVARLREGESYEDPAMTAANEVLRNAGQPVPPIQPLRSVIARTDPSISAALAAAEREHPETRTANTVYFLELGTRRLLVFDDISESKPDLTAAPFGAPIVVPVQN